MESLKVQIYAGKCRTRLTLVVSLVFGFLFPFSVAFFVLLHEGFLTLQEFSILFGFLYGACLLFLFHVARDYRNEFKKISDMIEMVNEGKELPSLEVLTKLKDLKNIGKDYEESEVSKMSLEEEEKRDDLIYHIVVERYKQEWKRTKDLDSKANNVIGSAGLLATLSGGITAGITKLLPQMQYEYLFVIPLIVFVLSAVFGLLAYWLTSFSAIDPDAIIREYGNRPRTELLRTFVATTSIVTMDNFQRNQRKVKWLYVAFVMLVLGIGLFFAITILNMYA